MKSKVRIKYLVCLAVQLTGGWLFISSMPNEPGPVQFFGWGVLMVATLYIFAMKCEKCGKSMFSELDIFNTKDATLNPISGFSKSMEKFQSQWSRGIWTFPFKKRCPFCDLERH
tara:strand:+ start:247 stop:588 length:342 start_codon:yes stop_codon:yes gene_type:complete